MISSTQNTTSTSISSIELVAIGDCNTSGTDNYNVPVSLARLISESTNIKCNLQNLGDAMNTSREGLLKASHLTHHPDIALLSFGLVDAWTTTIPSIYISYYPDSYYKRRSRKLLKSIKKKLRSPVFRKYLPTGVVVSEHEFQRNIEKIISTLKIKNPNIKLLFWGAPPVEDEPRNTHLVSYNKILRDSAKKHKGEYINTREIVCQLSRNEMFDDPVHLSQKACNHIAQSMLPFALNLLKL